MTLVAIVSATLQFGTLNLNEFKQIEQELHNSNSALNEKKAEGVFKAYLEQENVEDVNFFKYSEAELDTHFATFWWNAHTKKGDKYKASSLKTLRHGLKWAIKNYGYENDITDEKYTSFTNKIQAFKSAIKELKKTDYVDYVECY